MLFAGRQRGGMLLRPPRRITSRASMSEGTRRRAPSGHATGGPSISLHGQRVRRVEEAFRSLPSRYQGADADFDATFQVRLGDVGRTWEVRACGERCQVRPSPTRDPDVVIGSDAATWIGLREGRLSGLDAFAQRRLYARGDLDLALGFEGLFRLPGDRPPLLRVTDVEIPGAKVRSLVSGEGTEHVICLHGLGSNKASFFQTVSALTPDHTVHAIDLPGFGASSKPARAGYDSRYFSRAVLRYMDAMGLDRAHLVGNSMGGRIALEVALADPDRALTVSLLAPALAFRKRRELVPLVKLVRPELAAIPHPIRAARVRATSGACSPDRSASTRPPPTSPPTSSAAPIGRAPRESPSLPPSATSTWTRRMASEASGRGWRSSGRHPSSCGESRTDWFRRRSRDTWPRHCPPRARSCCRSAATYRRSSWPNAPTDSSATRSPRWPRRPHAARPSGASHDVRHFRSDVVRGTTS